MRLITTPIGKCKFDYTTMRKRQEYPSYIISPVYYEYICPCGDGIWSHQSELTESRIFRSGPFGRKMLCSKSVRFHFHYCTRGTQASLCMLRIHYCFGFGCDINLRCLVSKVFEFSDYYGKFFFVVVTV